MKLEDMILVSENNKGLEINYLTDFREYFNTIADICGDSRMHIPVQVQELYETKEVMSKWSEIHSAAKKTCHARFCANEYQLKTFLQGCYNDTVDYVFDEERSAEPCMDLLRAYELKTDGSRDRDGDFSYTKLRHNFCQGEVIQNLNGYSYRIIDVLTEKNLLLLSLENNEFIVGKGTDYFVKQPKGSEAGNGCGAIYGVEWSNGIYLGYDFRNINFEDIYRKYGKGNRAKDITEYRLSLRRSFFMLANLAENKNLTEEVRSAALQNLETAFRTDDEEIFLDQLLDGDYDKGFHQKNISSRNGKAR